MKDSLYWIWFQTLFGIGTRRAELLLNYFEHPQEIYDGIRQNNRVAGMLEPRELEASELALEQAAEIQRRTLKKGCDIITPDHPDYPELLMPIYSRPAALYVKGDLSCLKGALSIAMVGTRHHTEYGKQAAQVLAEALGRNGVVVISGLAHGIDTDSHQAALEAGGYSIGVLGCGIDVDYPSGSAEVKRAMSEKGAVITEYPLGTTPQAFNFPLRNRIISGLSYGVIVVEADPSSGSLITARHALDQGRDVFAVPGSIFSYKEMGTHQLIKEGARLIDCAGDVLSEYLHLDLPKTKISVHDLQKSAFTIMEPQLREETEKKPKRKAKKKQALPEAISPDCVKVYEYLETETRSVDEISAGTGLATAQVQAALTELEIYGLVTGYPGRRFGI